MRLPAAPLLGYDAHMAVRDPQDMAAEIAEQLRRKLAIRGGDTLVEQLPRARTLLPRQVRRAAWLVGQAAERSAHPKLRKQVDLPAVAVAHRQVMQHLDAVDVRARRIDMLLGIAASISVNLVLLAVGLIAVARWMPV